MIIAAGRGKRLENFTDNTPKPLVNVGGSSFFKNTIKHFKAIGINDIAAVVGYKKEQFHQINGIKFYENKNWENNNILHSLFSAKEFMDDEIIIAYGDIWFEKEVFTKLYNAKGGITLCVDSNWEEYYVGRTDHPISEAENIHYYNNKITKIGKHIYQSSNYCVNVGEFMGLIKVSKDAINGFVKAYEELCANTNMVDKFENSYMFEKAYLTDFIQYLINKSYHIGYCLYNKGWYEIDTIQDLENLKSRI